MQLQRNDLRKRSHRLPRVRETNPTKLVFAVEDVQSERARLEALGVTIVLRPWGTCDGVDPEGNVFQISAPDPT